MYNINAIVWCCLWFVDPIVRARMCFHLHMFICVSVWLHFLSAIQWVFVYKHYGFGSMPWEVDQMALEHWLPVSSLWSSAEPHTDPLITADEQIESGSSSTVTRLGTHSARLRLFWFTYRLLVNRHWFICCTELQTNVVWSPYPGLAWVLEEM